MSGIDRLSISALVFGAAIGLCGLQSESPVIAPQKPAPWVPPQTALPKEFVDAVAFMLENGLEDPRGAKFLAATVKQADQSVTGQKLMMGWLRKDRKTFLATSGDEYSVSSVKSQGDGLLVVIEEMPIRRVFGPQYRLKAAEMLILGEAKLAEDVYNKDQLSPQIFLDVTRDFLAVKFISAVESHMNGADKETLEKVAELQKLRPLYEARAAAGMTEDEIKMRTEYAFPPITKDSRLYSFLGPIDALGKDAARRLSQSRQPADPENIKNQAERIAARIQLLDQVDAKQWGQPGGVNLVWDPRVKALVDEGEAAMEPLLKTMAEDNRLTRSVSFGRDFFPQRHVISVAEAARAAIQSLLSVTLSAETPAGEVEAYRSYWLKTKGLSPEERWMKELEDESAGSHRWLDAARSLFMRTNSTKEGQWVKTVPAAPGEPEPGYKAEVLRKKLNPSLSELLARRSRRFLIGEAKGVFDYHSSLHFSLYLYQWEPEAALPLLQTAVRATILEPRHRNGQGNVDIVSPLLAQAVAARYKLGDKAAFQEWFDWIITIQPIAGNDRGRSLYPLYALRSEPSVRKATDELFTGADSKWNLRNLAKTDPYAIRNFVFTFLISTRTVKEALIDILSDETEIATVSLDSSQMVVMFRNSTLSSSVPSEIRSKESHLTIIVGEQPVRVCDYVAHLIEPLKGAPRVGLYWQKEDRNAALAKLRDFIRLLPEDLNEVLPWPYDEEMRPYPS